jgi:hypothetical protein
MVYTQANYFKYQKKWRKENRNWLNEQSRKRSKARHKLVIDYCGGRCVLCGRSEEETKSALIIHELRGRKHPNPLLAKGVSYILSHSNDFVVLCRPHHATIHRLKNEGKLCILIELCKALQGLPAENPLRCLSLE